MPDRTPKPERQHIAHGPAVSVRDVLREMPAHYVAAMEDNDKLRPCCRKAKDHTVQLFKTHEDAPGPDLAVFVCSCGRKHYRAAVAPGKAT